LTEQLLGELDRAKHSPEHPHHVAAEDFADAFGRMVSCRELCCQVFPVEEFGANAGAPINWILAPVAFCKFGGEGRRDAFGLLVRAVPDQ